MKTSYLLVVFATILVFAQALTDEESGVLVLNKETFKSEIKTQKNLLVYFYAPWCGHCKRLAPEWQEASQTLKDADIKLAKVDATVEKDLANEYDLKGYPTIFFFQNGQKEIFDGGRKSADIVRWVYKKIGQESNLISSTEQLSTFKSANKVGFVFFTTKEETQNWNVYASLAKEFQKLNFAHVYDSSLATSEGVSVGQVVAYTTYTSGKQVFTKAFTTEELRKFIEESQLDTVMEFDDLAVDAIFFKKRPGVFFFNNETEEAKSQLEVFRKFAETKKDSEFIFTVTSPNDGHGQWEQLTNYLRISNKEAPFALYVRSLPTKIEKEKLSEVTTENLESFFTKVQKMYNGEVQEEQAASDNKQKKDDL